MSQIISSPEDLKGIARELFPQFSHRQIVLLNGPMGVGKTELVKQLCHVLKMDAASSPSFSLHNRYENDSIAMDHWDLYRLESEDDLASSGFWDMLQQQQGLIFIEWAEKLGTTSFGKHWSVMEVHMSFDAEDSQKRIFNWEKIK